MRFRNTTHWPDHFLRRMLSWVAKQVGVKPSSIRQAEFGKRSRGPFNGRAWSTGRIRVVIGPASAFPIEPFHYPGRTHDAKQYQRKARYYEKAAASRS